MPKEAKERNITEVLDRNILALLERRKTEEQELGWHDRMAEAVTRFAGSMAFLYIHLVIYSLWIAINLGWIPRTPKFDRSFVILAMEGDS